MARSETISNPGSTDEKLRQSLQEASATVAQADKTVARVERHIMRCDVVLRRLRLLADTKR